MSAVLSSPVAPALTREELLEAERRNVLSHYAIEQRSALYQLYQLVKRCPDTGSGIRATKFLLGLYNGPRFPFDLTDLRCFDESDFHAAMTVLRMDATRTWCEIHVLLDAILGPGSDTGAEFEHLAYDLGLPNCGKKKHLPPLPLVDFR